MLPLNPEFGAFSVDVLPPTVFSSFGPLLGEGKESCEKTQKRRGKEKEKNSIKCRKGEIGKDGDGANGGNGESNNVSEESNTEVQLERGGAGGNN